MLMVLVSGVIPCGEHEDYARMAWILNNAICEEGGVCEVSVLVDTIFFQWAQEFSYEDPGDIRRINGPLSAVGMMSREGGWQPSMVVVGFENEMFSMTLHDCSELDRMVQLGVYSPDEIGEFILENLVEY